MPQYGYQCLNGHREDYFVKSYRDRYCDTMICHICGESMGPIIEVSNRMLYFEEGKPRVMMNLGPEPVVVTSEAQHRKLMKQRGVEFAGSRRGTKGSWI